MAIKLDQNKTFDRMKWDFLFTIMNKMGFDSRNLGDKMDFSIYYDYIAGVFLINNEEYYSLKS